MTGWAGIAALVAASLVAMCHVAFAATRHSIVQFQVSPSTRGSVSRPAPVSIVFGLSTRDTNASRRAAPVKSYELASEGLVPFGVSFPACSIAKLRRVRGVPAGCGRAQVGSGLIRGAGGLAEDTSMKDSVPCNLKARVYNTGSGMALRLDGKPPLPPSFSSTRLGCVVPIHTAIAIRVSKTTIGGVPSSELSFTLPNALLHPLDGWDASLRVVNVRIAQRRAAAVVKGKRRTVGFFSSVGCAGSSRALRVTFVGENGGRGVATRDTAC